MKSKPMFPTAFLLPALSLAVLMNGDSLYYSSAFAQDRTEEELTQRLDDASAVVLDASEAVEDTIEEVTEHVAEVGEEFSEALEKWMKQHSGELEQWSKEHGQEWARWGQRLERRLEKWSDEQEKHWQSWAANYESRMQGIAQQLEQNELSGDEVSKLVETNLKLLSEIPLGQMIQQGIREGASELESAPWQSLDDLSRIAGDAVADSLESAEELSGSALHRTIGTAFNRGQEIDKIREGLKRAFHQQRHEILELFERRVDALQGLVEEGGEDAEAARRMVERLERGLEKKVHQLERQHKRRQQQLEYESKNQRDTVPPKRRTETAKAASAEKELQSLRNEVEKLRQEVQKLKASQEDK